MPFEEEAYRPRKRGTEFIPSRSGVGGQAVYIRGELSGDAELIALLRTLPLDLQAYAIEPAVRKAVKAVAQAQKDAAPIRSGLLRQSIGIAKIKVYPRTGSAWGAAGPRRGFRRALISKKGELGFASKKRTAKLEASGEAKIANPIKYAHLAGPGRRQTFMTHAYAMSETLVQEIMSSEIRKGIERSVQRLAKRS